MRTLRSFRCLALAALFSSLSLLSVSGADRTQYAQSPNDTTVAEAREEISALLSHWDKARLVVHRKAMRSMLAPDYKLTVNSRSLNAEEWLTAVDDNTDRISNKRYSAAVLSIQKTEIGWTAMVQSKIERQLKEPDGELTTFKTLRVSKDNFAEVDGRWVFLSSELIGWQTWRNEQPPFKDW